MNFLLFLVAASNIEIESRGKTVLLFLEIGSTSNPVAKAFFSPSHSSFCVAWRSLPILARGGGPQQWHQISVSFF
jgi:hypothetical protein